MDLRDQLQRTLGDSYRLERELGGGGMSRVFVAEENALGRKVVVKVLLPELAAGVSTERFAREIRVAARLQQANIVPLLTAGETGALPYYTMPYVEGESLRRRLGDGPVSISEAVSILRDVARALAYAHEHGVIHRDIKPENVLISGGAAVVTDFGIAKALAAAATQGERPEDENPKDPSVSSLTALGTAIGTPAYMAPEQALADPTTDHRADLYSFGCLAYELLTGTTPFHGRTLQQTLAAHVHQAPAPIETLRPDTPHALAALVERCLSKDPAARPQNARDVVQLLETVTTGPTPMRALLTSAGRLSRRSALMTVGIVTVVALGAFAAWTFASRARVRATGRAPRTLAVMPFTNVGADSTQEYFADGIALDLTNALGKVAGLSVTSRSLAFTYKGRSVDPRTVGKELNVDAIVEATVQRAGGRLRVTAQLTRTADGVSMWSNRYERDVKDLFAVQDDISNAILSELRLTLRGDRAAPGRPAVAGTANFDAYDSYLRGVYLLDHRGPGVAKSIEYFNAAIAKDSGLARAWGALSEALELMPFFGETPASAVEARAVAAAERALSLDSSVTEAYIGLGLARDHAFRWQDAEDEFRRAIAVDSTSAVAYMQYGRHLTHVGRIESALAAFRRATQLDPVSGTAFVWLAHMYSAYAQFDSALAIGRRARELDPGLILARTIGAMDAIEAGRSDEARALVTALVAPPPWRGQAMYSLGMAGDTTTVRAAVHDFERMPRGTWLLHTALVYAHLGLGDTSRAVSELERALAARETTPDWNSFSDRMFDPIRHSARFAAVVRGFGLDEALMTSARGGRPAK
jgi:eukaryotic-like serine/threonine-protein kinase